MCGRPLLGQSCSDIYEIWYTFISSAQLEGGHFDCFVSFLCFMQTPSRGFIGFVSNLVGITHWLMYIVQTPPRGFDRSIPIWVSRMARRCWQSIVKHLCFHITALPWRGIKFAHFATKQDAVVIWLYTVQPSPNFTYTIRALHTSTFTNSQSATCW